MEHDSFQSDQCAEKLRSLSEPIRLRIIDHLRLGELNVSSLAKALRLEVVTVSHHLGILKNADIVERQRDGRCMIYRLRDGVIDIRKRKDGFDHLNLGCCRIEMPRLDETEQ